uniref:Uncharacterized protein n=1 Tax=Arundo donax TaxID=35708 RepID=A0A0A8YMT4_ARUDO
MLQTQNMLHQKIQRIIFKFYICRWKHYTGFVSTIFHPNDIQS